MTHKHPPRGKGVVRWFAKLTDEQLSEFLYRLECQLAKTGQDPGPLREVMIEFATKMPSSTEVLQ